MESIKLLITIIRLLLSRIKLSRLFGIMVRSWLSIALGKTNRSRAQLWTCAQNSIVRKTYPWIPPHTASLYTIAWFGTIRWSTLCAKLPKCDTTLFPEDDIKIYDRSRPQSSRGHNHVYTNICGSARIPRKTLCREGVCRFQRRTCSLSLYFRMPLPMGSSFKIWKILRFLVDCETSWIIMGRWDDPVQHGETVYYNGRDGQRRLMMKLSCTSRDVRSENGCGICS